MSIRRFMVKMLTHTFLDPIFHRGRESAADHHNDLTYIRSNMVMIKFSYDLS
jgi:hypothetical protein